MSLKTQKSPRSRTVAANGQSFHVLEAGAKDQPLILFMHGFPGYAGMWQHYLEALSHAYHAVAFDQRGYNLSSKPTAVTDYRMPLLVEDVKALVAALGHDQAYLVAHDWGGFVAWHAVGTYPQVFPKAVIINAPHPQIYAKLYAHDPDQKKRSHYTKLLRLRGVERLLACGNHLILRKGIFSKAKRPFTAEEQRGYQAAWRRGLKYPTYYYKANFAAMDVEFKHAAASSVPTLLLWGEQDDYLSPHNLDGMEPWASQLTIKRYPEATHWLQHEKWPELVVEIQSFLSKT